MKKQEKIDALKKLRAYTRREECLSGLCYNINNMSLSNKLVGKEYFYLMDLLYSLNRKLQYSGDSDYCWKPEVKAPRIKWLTEKIKELEK